MININDFKNILIIRFDGMGDIIMGSPVFREIRNNYTGNMYAAVKPEKYPILQYCPYNIKDILLFDNNYMDINIIKNWVCNNKIDLIISPRWVYSEKIKKILSNFPDIFKVGYNDSGFKFDLSTKVEDNYLNETYKNLNLLRLLNIEYKSAKTEFWPMPFYDFRMNYIYNNYKYNPEINKVVISIAASEGYKRWNPKNYAKLLDLLYKKYNCMIFLVGGLDVINDSYIVQQNCTTDIFNLVGKIDIFMVYELMRHSNYIIGNDSGPMHISRTTGVPNITLIREDDRGSRCFGPIENNGKAIYCKCTDGINSITIEELFEGILVDYGI